MPKPAPRPKAERSKTSRERTLSQAIDLFATHGFEAMTMRVLGDAVGLDNSSLYRHFPSKAALIDEVLDRAAGDVFAAIAPFIDPVAPLTLSSLEDIGAAAGRYLFDHPSTARLIVHWIMSMGDERGGARISVPATDKRRPGGQLLSLLRARLDDAVKNGRVREHATPEALVILIGAAVVRPATYGHLFKTLEPKRTRAQARAAWEQELRAAIRGAFKP